MRGDPSSHPGRRPHGVRHPFHPQAARRAVAHLIHPHPGRTGLDRSWPVQRGVLLPGQHLAALLPDRLKRDCRGDDGWTRRAGADPGRDRGSGGLPSPGRPVLPGVQGEEAVVLRAVERRHGQGSQDRQAGAVPQGLARAAGHRSRTAGCCIPGTTGTGSRDCPTAVACSTPSSSASSAPAWDGTASSRSGAFRPTWSLPTWGATASSHPAPPTTWCSSSSRWASRRASGAR